MNFIVKIFVASILIFIRPCTADENQNRTSNARLPLDLKPFHYNLLLQPFLYGNRSIHGRVEVQFEVLNRTDKFIFNLMDILSRNETAKISPLNNYSAPNIEIIKQEYDQENNFYIAQLNQSLQVGDAYVFEMDYIGYLNDKLVGFYFSSYEDENGIERQMASTQFSPTDARRAFPCFDEPSFKATFNISIVRFKNQTSLSCMPLITTNQVDGNPDWEKDVFEKTLLMSTYFVGFLVFDFASMESSLIPNVTFKVWTRKQALSQASYSLDIAPKVLLALETYFNLPFPLPKLDMVAVPNFKFNGMENWGLIKYRETAMLFDSQASTVKSKRRLATVVGHEVAHMWFGNLVTPHWWSDLWLKEGFANFMGYTAVDEVEPSWNLRDYFVYNIMKEALDIDALLSSHPINVQVFHPREIAQIFDTISYRKGSTVIRMMQYFLTEEVFKAGLTNYLDILAYGNAEQDDLWNFMTTAWMKDANNSKNELETNTDNKESTISKSLINSEMKTITDASVTDYQDVKAIMDTWTLKEGYPLITVNRIGSKAILSQERFLLSNETCTKKVTINNTQVIECNTTDGKSEALSGGWWVPVSFVAKDNLLEVSSKPSYWMKPNQKTIEIDGMPDYSQWVLFNIEAAGYYRVNYDENNWDLLIHQLKTNHSQIHKYNRALLIDDAFNLARAGILDYRIPLEMSQYLKAENELTVWEMFIKNYKLIMEAIDDATEKQLINNHMLSLISSLYDRVGIVASESDTYDTQSLRILCVKYACKAGHKQCIADVSQAFDQWISAKGGEYRITPDIKPTVLCEGVKGSDERIWNVTWNRFKKSNVQSEKVDLIKALGCTLDEAIIERYLNMSFDTTDGVKKQNSADVFKGLANTAKGRNLAWKRIQNNWKFMLEFHGFQSNALWTLLSRPQKYFNTQHQLDELLSFRSKEAGYLGSAKQTLDQTIEKVKINVYWKQNAYPSLKSWLIGSV